ncbi:MAG: ATP-dependent DNA helicase RecG [Bacteroidales bacterium]|jgi:ATP-dependent DNA helicase RecG|nr:ATP-dependent DNA helicase RecG [Bacteroidales bacterium]MCI2121809.1 ATP-dependent DNA helicase RecG [Bacteroidales bacterium]MCI2144665.1 ATP-dependent DNA helicase RecG [Bacteroidales bacterium]
MTDVFDSDIKYLPGVGPARAKLLESELNVSTFRDLLYIFPFRYVDRSKFYRISEIDGTLQYIQLRGKITDVAVAGQSRGRRLVATLEDGTGSIDLVFFQGLKWIAAKLKVGQEYVVFGKPSVFNERFNMVHPEVDLATDNNPEYETYVRGVYPGTEKLRNGGISNKVFAKLEYTLLKSHGMQIRETLPPGLMADKNLCPLREALVFIHFPLDNAKLAAAQYRLKFEELFYLQLSLLRQKFVRTRASSGIVFPKVGPHFNYVYGKLPFELTDAQKRVIKEIRADFLSGRQMNRLLQGDVGSGKTAVALLTALLAVDNGYQACIMAPTEVLANQHYNGIAKLLEGSGVTCALLTGNTKAGERETIHAGLEDGSIDIMFGTHALLEDNVVFKNLGYAVIDEQHRFGVEQRARLWVKGKELPHVLVMTATPIPRTLAMTLYGDLDVSVLDKLPPGRIPVQTLHFPESRREAVYAFMKKQIKAGRQVFVVYPLIEESEKMDYKNLEDGYEMIKENFPSPEYVTAVVHGKQKPADKDFGMQAFESGRADILVATSVIEVGVDVPNATVMVIESAERFGLSQLHQLRGRVGRGAQQSYCILMTGYKLSRESKRRIEMICSTNDGFEIAEADMRMRGPGDIAGTQQSGLAVELHISDLAKDSPILEDARRTATLVLESDPALEKPASSLYARELRRIRKDITDYSQIS